MLGTLWFRHESSLCQPSFSLSVFFLLSICGFHAHGKSESVDSPEGNWMNWRGPLYNGSSPKSSVGCELPVKFNEEKGFKWKASLPGSSAATPIIFNNFVFVSSILDLKDSKNKGEGEACLRCALTETAEICFGKGMRGVVTVREEGTEPTTNLIPNQIMRVPRP